MVETSKTNYILKTSKTNYTLETSKTNYITKIRNLELQTRNLERYLFNKYGYSGGLTLF